MIFGLLANTHKARFCLLEQYLPNGAAHPFAGTMLKHFNKLHTPLKSVHSYPSLADQRRRFINRGWSSVIARNLWDLWSDDCFLPIQQRVELNKVEAFDEWEEFALFASHYFLLMASKGPQAATSAPYFADKDEPQSQECIVPSESYLPLRPSMGSQMRCVYHTQAPRHRRYGAVSKIQEGMISHHGGQGTQGRLQSADVFAAEDVLPHDGVFQSLIAEARMCHTITNLSDYGRLLVGGRTSPDRALADCWYHGESMWNRVEDLPNPLYRHSACFVTNGSDFNGILIYGGRSLNSTVMNDWLLWQSKVGWKKLACIGGTLQPRFSASIAASLHTSGVLLGGMSADGTVFQEIWRWSLVTGGFDCYITVQNLSHNIDASPNLRYAIPRVGACAISLPMGLLLIGGISANCILPDNYDILLIQYNSEFPSKDNCIMQVFFLQPCDRENRPLLVGHSTISYAGSVIIVGGGAVCFSFGTFWNSGLWSVEFGAEAHQRSWCLIEQQASKSIASPTLVSDPSQNHRACYSSNLLPNVPRLRMKNSASFKRMISNLKPVIIEELEIGPCVQLWTSKYLKEAVDVERSVSTLRVDL